MSEKSKQNLTFGKQTSNFSLRQLEVINIASGKVAVNEGSIFFGHSPIQLNKENFISSAKPYDIVTGSADNSSLWLETKVNDYVCLVIKNRNSSFPKLSLESIPQSKIGDDSFERVGNVVIKLAFIRSETTLEDDSKIFEIENLYDSTVWENNVPMSPFKPILWAIENDLQFEGEQTTPQSDIWKKLSVKKWKCIFSPASLVVFNTMEEPVPFSLNGALMTEFPIVEVQAGDEYSVVFELSSSWEIKGTPEFLKNPDSEIDPVKPNNCCGETNCETSDGKYKVKILKFVAAENGGLTIEQYWNSDIGIHGWGVVKCSDDSNDSGGSDGSDDSGGSDDGSDDGSDKSTAIVPVKWSKTGYTALFIVESPEVRFEDVISCSLSRFNHFVGVDQKFVSVCEKDSISVIGYSCNKPIPIGFEVKNGVIYIEKPILSYLYKSLDLKIKISGLRKGHGGKRFPTRTKAQFEKNEKFLQSAY